MKVITFVYNSVAKVSSYISIGLLASGIIVGTSACNRENITTIQHGSEEFASSSVVLKVEQIKPENSDVSKPLPKSNLPYSSRTLLADTQIQNVQPSVEQKENGKLRFVNDTPYMSIVYIYGFTQKSYKYAYVPPCTTRELYNTYSNSQLISLNGHAKFPIAKKAKRESDFFAIKMSALVDNSEQEQLCELNSSETLDIFNPTDEWKAALSGVKTFLGLVDNSTYERITGKIMSGAEDVNIKQVTSLLNQLSEAVDDKVKSLAGTYNKADDKVKSLAGTYNKADDKVKSLAVTYNNDPASITDGIKSSDKLFKGIWAAHLAPAGGSNDERYMYFLSSRQRKIELGEIKTVDELITDLRELQKNCDPFYSVFLAKFIDAAPQFFAFYAKLSTTKKVVKFSSSNATSTPQPKLVKLKNVLNEGLYKALKATPKCVSTRNDNPVFTLISGHSRPRFQTVPQ